MLLLRFPLEVLKGLISFFYLFCIIFLHYANFAIVRESKIYFLTNESDVHPSRSNNRLYSFSNWVINLFNHLSVYLFHNCPFIHLSTYFFIYLLISFSLVFKYPCFLTIHSPGLLLPSRQMQWVRDILILFTLSIILTLLTFSGIFNSIPHKKVTTYFINPYFIPSDISDVFLLYIIKKPSWCKLSLLQ